jgi:hypothetical protein
MDNRKRVQTSEPTPAHLDELLDEALKQTFPASDAVAIDIERGSDNQQDTKPHLP